MITATEIPPLATLAGAQASPRATAEYLRDLAAQRIAMRVPMKFLKEWSGNEGNYRAGEIAGFDPVSADHLERTGTATRNLQHVPTLEIAAAQSAVAHNIVPLLFKQPWGNYAPGDVADAATIRRLTAAGIAELTEPASVIRHTLSSIRDAVLRR